MKIGGVIMLTELGDLGTAHLMFHLQPSTLQAYERLTEAVRLYQQRGSRDSHAEVCQVHEDKNIVILSFVSP
jgi:hypothetical protein